jgi:hypothetical protein
MRRNPPPWDCVNWIGLSIFALILAATSAMPIVWAQGSSSQSLQAQAQSAQYPPGRPQPIAVQCQNALADRITADARRRVTVDLATQNPYSPSNGLQGLRGRLRYGIGGPNSWRTATYNCVVDVRRGRVERATYTPRASSSNGPGGPGYPGGPGGPGIPSYPRVRVDTSGRGTFNSRAAGSVRITRGFVDSTGARPSVSLRGGDFRITFYGVVERSDGGGFTIRITGSDRGSARGTAQARLNDDRNEVESITVNGRLGRDNFTGNFSR